MQVSQKKPLRVRQLIWCPSRSLRWTTQESETNEGWVTAPFIDDEREQQQVDGNKTVKISAEDYRNVL